MHHFRQYLFALTLLFCSGLSPIYAAEDNTVPLEELRLFSEVFHQIRSNYVKEVSDEQLLQYAIEGMLSGLDPHSAWLDKESFLSLNEMTKGEFAGIGIEVMQEGNALRIIAPIDNTPAQRAGILAGDILIQIDDTHLKGLSLNESIELMRGSKGSPVTLTLLRDNEKKPIEITLKRDIIKIESVKSHLINEHYGYLRIAQFQNNTAADAKQHLETMLKDTDNQLHGLIIDLRNNPGGVLTAAVELSDAFIKQGLIVYTEGRSKESREEFFASGEGAFTDILIVVLINSGSASASEIVAGALQDHRRALILGNSSFGKGSVQTILPVPNENAIKLTTALYYTPLGRSIQAQGITADIESNKATITEQTPRLVITELNLARHLDNKKSAKKKTEPQTPAASRLLNDYQVHEAINILKAMHFSQH